MTKLEKLEIEKSKQYDEPIWIIKKGSYYYLKRVATGNIIPYTKYKNLKEIEESL